MQGLGNALSPVQAILALEQAASLCKNGCHPDNTLAVQSCLRERLTASNHVLLPCAQGWVLAQQSQIPEVAEVWPDSLPWGQTIAPLPPDLRQFWLHDDARLCRLVLPSDISLADALRTLGIDIPSELEEPYEQAAVPFVPTGLPPSQDAGILEVPALPFLTLCGIDTSASAIDSGIQPHPLLSGRPGYAPVDSSDGTLARPCLILSSTACFLFERECSGFFWAIACLQELLLRSACCPSPQAMWTTVQGRQIPSLKNLPAVVLLQIGLEVDLFTTPTCSDVALTGINVSSVAAPFMLHLSPDADADMGYSLPRHWLSALGWQPVRLPSVSPPGSHILFRPTPFGLQLPSQALPALLADMLVAGALDCWPRPQRLSSDLIAVKVQVWGHTLWQGSLPSTVTFERVLQLWLDAHRVCQVPRRARVYFWTSSC